MIYSEEIDLLVRMCHPKEIAYIDRGIELRNECGMSATDYQAHAGKPPKFFKEWYHRYSNAMVKAITKGTIKPEPLFSDHKSGVILIALESDVPAIKHYLQNLNKPSCRYSPLPNG